MFIELLAYVGVVIGLTALVAVLGIALYALSEQLESHTRLSKRYITQYIYAVMAAHVLLWVGDGLPVALVAPTLLLNYIYLCVMSSFPVIRLSSPLFVSACIGAVASHFGWFWYFTRTNLPPHSILQRNPGYTGETLPPFSQIVSFFGLLIWTVPFVLFLSLSANDNVLPTTSLDNTKVVHRKGLAHQIMDRLIELMDRIIAQLGLKARTAPKLPI